MKPFFILLLIASYIPSALTQILEEVIVDAARIPLSVIQAPFAIDRIEREQIVRAQTQLGLDESLASIPGLVLQNRFNFAQDLRISIRGFGARANFGIRGVKILVDGIPETLADGQGGIDSIDLTSIGSIEVLRGPSSSLYGNASGGVIHIESDFDRPDSGIEARLAIG
ncbi:MAG TPA: TonB-dependent receptor, partial [Cellvibrionales bacterium]|nr:TonB-dependent receptor [Cellvibrionales bacterium]